MTGCQLEAVAVLVGLWVVCRLFCGQPVGRRVGAAQASDHDPGGILATVRFRTVVELGGKTATGLAVPKDIVAGLGPGKRPAVLVTIGTIATGRPWRRGVADSSCRSARTTVPQQESPLTTR